jgi:hypothetical protein
MHVILLCIQNEILLHTSFSEYVFNTACSWGFHVYVRTTLRINQCDRMYTKRSECTRRFCDAILSYICKL